MKEASSQQSEVRSGDARIQLRKRTASAMPQSANGAGALVRAGRHRHSLRGVCAGIAITIAALLLAAGWLRDSAPAALAAEPSYAAEVAEAIERLPVVGSVLLTGAHPDDENNPLLAYLARGLHLRTAYLSATRGDGGQNLIGDEQYEALGVLRTEELLAARRLDGAQQFFGQEYDFGFSKSADETFQKWGHDNVLGDYVRIIRRFRPDIVISRFTGTPADGHGHHQVSGIVTKEAFRAAADPSRFPEQIAWGLKPWQASKLFINRGGFGGNSGPAGPNGFSRTIGGFSPLYGESLGDLGMEARSQHRSQGQGSAKRGSYSNVFQLVDSVTPSSGAPKSLFEGIDLTFNRFNALAEGAPAVAQDVQGIETAIDQARAALTPLHPERTLPALSSGGSLLMQLQSDVQQANVPETSKDQATFLLQEKTKDFAEAARLAGGVRLDALADTAEIIPGEPFQVTVSGEVTASNDLRIGDISLSASGSGWKIESTGTDGGDDPDGAVIRRKFRVTPPADAPLSQPYWLVSPRQKDYFGSTSDPWVGNPYGPAVLSVSYSLQLAGGSRPSLPEHADVVYRYTDHIYGQRERPLVVVPAIAVWIGPGVSVFPTAESSSQFVLVRARNNTASEQRPVIQLQLPEGWKSSPTEQEVPLKTGGEDTSVRFEVLPPIAAAGVSPQSLQVKAVAEADGKQYSTGYQVVDYPHIQTRYLFHPAVATLLRLDVKVAPGLKVGYVMGSGDEVPAALKELGIPVTELGPEELSFGDLKQFDVIVMGIRAYEVRKDVSANQSRLMDYVSNGGTMIVQYSRTGTGGFSDPLGPYPFKVGGNANRVTHEEAPVQVLDPGNPLFHSPNEITAQDFDGWVQERGSYFMESWSPEYKPLLSSNDPGEAPQKGGMLEASYGKGLYIYTGYTFFRQLPAGVPGAYRLLANLISLGKKQ